jgi:hypothetical protein
VLERHGGYTIVRCARCERRSESGRALCDVCLPLLLACRRAVKTLVLTDFVEHAGPRGGYLFKPGAQQAAQLLLDTDPARFGYVDEREAAA